MILNYFLNDLTKQPDGGGQSLILLLSFVAMALTIVMAFPLVIFPCRYALDVMLFHDAEPNWCRHFILTGIICGCTLIVSLFVPNISVVFQLMGGTTSAFVCFVLPAAFVIHLEGQQRLQDGQHLNNNYTPLYGSIAGNVDNSILANDKASAQYISRCEVYGSWLLATMGVIVGLVSTTVTIYNLVDSNN